MSDNARTARGFSIRIFVVDGLPTGLRVVEKSNWIGQGLVCPRAKFAEAKSRSEFGKAGVYVLTGPSESGQERVYVGEGDPVRPRLEQHAGKKDFWTQAIIFTSKDEHLNKAHVQYLEARLVELAREAKRCDLDNANLPQRPSLSEADQAEVEAFLDEMLLCFPVLGVPAFEQPAASTERQRLLYLRAKGLEARGYESSEGFVVLAGSQVCAQEAPSIPHHLRELRQSLMSREVLRSDGNHYVVAQDYTFNSPSTAAGVLLARSANGRSEWKDQGGQTLRAIQESQTEAPAE